jgi:hypothetical protein
VSLARPARPGGPAALPGVTIGQRGLA